ncbi:MAG: lysophospholipid acyltransferase family protein [Rhizobiaceae bacterium]
MVDESAGPRAASVKRRPNLLKSMWQRVRGPIARSRVVKWSLATLIVWILRVVRVTNPLVAGSNTPRDLDPAHLPVIFATWHGQHFLSPSFYPREMGLAAMFSRSADAELNAVVFERLGFKAVRGSGGRPGVQVGKGGTLALIELKRHLDAKTNVAMIADIAHGKARESGLGIITLAKLSGRPIVPLATVTSRRRVLEKSWDRTTIPLPFGRSAVLAGDAIWVPSDASADLLEEKRRELTRLLNETTDRAYRMVDGGS